MSDVLVALATSLGPILGLGIGYVAGRRRAPKVVAAPRIEAMCTCEHPLSSHDPQTNRCEEEDGHHYEGPSYDRVRISRPCRCRQYVGPQPIDQVFAPGVLPE